MHPDVTLILLGAGIIAIYVAWNLMYPYVACGTCDSGKRYAGRTWKVCSTCQGKNKRIRPGRYLLRIFGVPLPK